MISSNQMEKYDQIICPRKKMNFYFTNNEDGSEINEESIFVNSYNLFMDKLNTSFPNLRGRYVTHIFLVGFSIQPIILSLTALRAKRIIFLFTRDTKDKCGEIADWTDKFYTHIGINQAYEFVGEDEWNSKNSFYCIDSSNPQDIYEKINNLIIEEDKNDTAISQIALDITGGKKTMVSGAFMAASINNIDTFYVDFSIYKNDKPEPGTEFLSELENPINLFINNLKNIFDDIKNDVPLNKKRLLYGEYRDFAQMLIETGFLNELSNESPFKKELKRIYDESI